MRGGGVIEHHVEHDTDTISFQLRDEFFEISHRPKHRVNVIVISDVVTVIILG